MIKRLGTPRDRPSRPARWLVEQGLISDNHLDWGCGYGKDAEFYGSDKYDLYHHNVPVTKQYDTITCTFVLNVVESESERLKIIKTLNDLLLPNGKVYITVIRERFIKEGSRFFIILDLPSIRLEKKTYEIYLLDKSPN